jgi:hypothetical protein
MNLIRIFRPFVLVFALPAVAIASDPMGELEKFSVFSKEDIAALTRGGIQTAPGRPMSTTRYLSVQSCFIVPQPPARVIATMKRFDPTKHPELKVYLHSDLPAAPSAANFAKLNNMPNNSAVRALIAATTKMSPDLQVSRAEAQKSVGQSIAAFWTDLLTKRAQDYVAGGAAAQAPYDHTRDAVYPGKDLAGVVRQQGNIGRQFASFLPATGLVGGKGSLQPDLYWELMEVQDQGVLALGASYIHSTSDGGAQTASGLYYASSGYNVLLTLHQLWQLKVDGRPSTLVWRGDLVSAASIGDLHGIGRLAAESAMRKDISRAAATLQRDSSQ